MHASTEAPNAASGVRYTYTARQAYPKDTAERGIDEETLEVRAVEGSLVNATGPKEPVDGSNIGDAPMLPELLNQIPSDQDIGSVTAPSRQIAAQSPDGQWTGHMTLANAMRRLRREMPMR
jgi:hypothetical protein